jgi:hypothetical protein
VRFFIFDTLLLAWKPDSLLVRDGARVGSRLHQPAMGMDAHQQTDAE